MASSDVLVNLLFYLFAALVAGGAIAVAASRNIVRSAFSLVAVLFGAAALYALMKADFIAAAQILIYVGGILVLIIFAVMLTHRITDVNVSNESTPGPAAFCACLCLLFALVVVILYAGKGKWQRGLPGEEVQAEGGSARLYQYQSDGKTGLAWGGNSFEDHVVLAIEAKGRSGSVRFEVAPTGDEKWSPVRTSTETLDADGRATLHVRDLLPARRNGKVDRDFRWRAVFAEGGSDRGPWMQRDERQTHFVVHDGVTQPVAFGLMGPYLLAFEVVSVLLLAALIGAAFLARKEVRA